jgi:DNA-binding FadR family transcriptional regulator
MSISGPLSDFIRAAFPSVWSLELLRLLRGEPVRDWTREALVAELRASDPVVAQALGALEAGGLVASQAAGTVRYSPATAELDQLAADAVALYAKRPDAVRRMIVFGSNASLQAFSEAFRLRGD